MAAVIGCAGRGHPAEGAGEGCDLTCCPPGRLCVGLWLASSRWGSFHSPRDTVWAGSCAEVRGGDVPKADEEIRIYIQVPPPPTPRRCKTGCQKSKEARGETDTWCWLFSFLFFLLT